MGGTVETPVGRVYALGLLSVPLFVTELPLLPAPPPPHPERNNMTGTKTNKGVNRLFFIFRNSRKLKVMIKLTYRDNFCNYLFSIATLYHPCITKNRSHRITS